MEVSRYGCTAADYITNGENILVFTMLLPRPSGTAWKYLIGIYYSAIKKQYVEKASVLIPRPSIYQGY